MEEGQPSFEVRFQDLFGRLLREQIHRRPTRLLPGGETAETPHWAGCELEVTMQSLCQRDLLNVSDANQKHDLITCVVSKHQTRLKFAP